MACIADIKVPLYSSQVNVMVTREVLSTVYHWSDKIENQDQYHWAPLFFNWDLLHTRLNSHYEALSHKKKKHKKIKAYRKSV